VPASRDPAVALELVHCASLVHDDLPCFDNAAIRRGRASVHARFGEDLAVLVGDALIVGAFDVLARAVRHTPWLVPALGVLARAIGARAGLVAGQAWEAEPHVDVGRYHRAKTGALFEAAATMGALAGAGAPADWRPLGQAIGAAYQLADDILDVGASPTARGKPVGQDLRLDRPSAVHQLGLEGACAALRRTVATLPELVPAAKGADEFRRWLAAATHRVFAPVDAAQRHAGAAASSLSA
jgi:geranylgeranyl diphosphate synthase type II